MGEKNPVVGGLLNVLIPGLAEIYVGRWFQAVVTFVGAILFFGLLFYLVGRLSDPPWPDFVCPGLVVVFYLVVMFYGGASTVRKSNASKT
jgi:TM2 domain-containing membrane protein YozV